MGYGTFQDTDGSGYVLIHGEIYKLSDDYKSVVEQINPNINIGIRIAHDVEKRRFVLSHWLASYQLGTKTTIIIILPIPSEVLGFREDLSLRKAR